MYSVFLASICANGIPRETRRPGTLEVFSISGRAVLRFRFCALATYFYQKHPLFRDLCGDQGGLWCTSRCHQNIIIVLPLFKSLHFCDSIKSRQMTVSRLFERQLIEISNLLVFVFLDISQYCNLNIYNESIKVTFEDRSNLKANLEMFFII